MTRRDMLTRTGMGMASLGLMGMLGGEASAAPEAATTNNPLLPRPSHFPSKAKHVIHLFMNGGPSHVDTFDPKPALEKYAGQTLPSGNLRTERKTGAAFPSPFKFKKYGQSGIEVSDLFPNVGSCIDDICVIRSMKAEVPNHEPSLMLMNCGDSIQARPAMGSWVTYGLGTENQNLPGFIAMCPNGFPTKGPDNWRAGFLPGVYQGTHIDTKFTEVEKLIENIRSDALTSSEQRRQLDLLQEFNRQHLARHEKESFLESRIQSFELAYGMQQEAAEAFDISLEPDKVRDDYGTSTFARQCLIARRLVERGVRFVQLYQGQGQPWDHHDDLEKGHSRLAQDSDQPIAALIRDLKARGLLDETLIIWGGEFGRTPTVELPQAGTNAGKVNGRDHNHYGFTTWMAGGGVKGGMVYGATDEFGFQAVEKPMHVHDLHATILHLLGFDHKKLTFRYAGRDFRLTDVHGNVIHDLIA